MSTTLWIAAAVVVTAVAIILIRKFLSDYMAYRGTNVITCPETHDEALVEVDARHAALTGFFSDSHIQLKNCSRWPINQDCGQDCLLQLDLAPLDCLVKGMLMKWYRGKECAFCHKVFDEIHWTDHKPALLASTGVTLEWDMISPSEFPNVLETHLPVCWNCHEAESFRRVHPDLVTDRPSRSEELHK